MMNGGVISLGQHSRNGRADVGSIAAGVGMVIAGAMLVSAETRWVYSRASVSAAYGFVDTRTTVAPTVGDPGDFTFSSSDAADDGDLYWLGLQPRPAGLVMPSQMPTGDIPAIQYARITLVAGAGSTLLIRVPSDLGQMIVIASRASQGAGAGFVTMTLSDGPDTVALASTNGADTGIFDVFAFYLPLLDMATQLHTAAFGSANVGVDRAKTVAMAAGTTALQSPAHGIPNGSIILCQRSVAAANSGHDRIIRVGNDFTIVSDNVLSAGAFDWIVLQPSMLAKLGL